VNVSPDFSLPIRVVAPYFVGGILFYILAMVSLLWVEPNIGMSDYRVIGWVHLYMIGFVMMIIIGAMAQMSVVVAEVHHRYPDLFRWIFPLLSLGTIVLVAGLYFSPLGMMAGGTLLLCALGLFAYNLFFTLKTSRRRTTVIRSMQWSTFFLLIGLGIGIVMASGYAGIVVIEPSYWREFHVFALIGGYVMINIMGVSTVVLPMFGACNRPSDNDYTISFGMMSGAVVMMLASVWVEWFGWMAFSLAVGSILHYMQSVYRIFTTKKRRYSDIWERSVAVAFASLVVALSVSVYGYISVNEKAMILGFWFFTTGFLGFLMSAHLYKIVPFLVWFERYVPHIDEKAVPMIHELLDQKWAKGQWLAGCAGILLVALAILLENWILFIGGIAVIIASGAMLLGAILKILRFRGVEE